VSKQFASTEVREAGAKHKIQAREPAPLEVNSMFDLVAIVLDQGMALLDEYVAKNNIHYNDPKFIEASSALLIGQNAIKKARTQYE